MRLKARLCLIELFCLPFTKFTEEPYPSGVWRNRHGQTLFLEEDSVFTPSDDYIFKHLLFLGNDFWYNFILDLLDEEEPESVEFPHIFYYNLGIE